MQEQVRHYWSPVGPYLLSDNDCAIQPKMADLVEDRLPMHEDRPVLWRRSRQPTKRTAGK